MLRWARSTASERRTVSKASVPCLASFNPLLCGYSLSQDLTDRHQLEAAVLRTVLYKFANHLYQCGSICFSSASQKWLWSCTIDHQGVAEKSGTNKTACFWTQYKHQTLTLPGSSCLSQVFLPTKYQAAPPEKNLLWRVPEGHQSSRCGPWAPAIPVMQAKFYS